jgi:predicted RNase H-like nuclease (RuvC/YqgF family)
MADDIDNKDYVKDIVELNDTIEQLSEENRVLKQEVENSKQIFQQMKYILKPLVDSAVDEAIADLVIQKVHP